MFAVGVSVSGNCVGWRDRQGHPRTRPEIGTTNEAHSLIFDPPSRHQAPAQSVRTPVVGSDQRAGDSLVTRRGAQLFQSEGVGARPADLATIVTFKANGSSIQLHLSVTIDYRALQGAAFRSWYGFGTRGRVEEPTHRGRRHYRVRPGPLRSGRRGDRRRHASLGISLS